MARHSFKKFIFHEIDSVIFFYGVCRFIRNALAQKTRARPNRRDRCQTRIGVRKNESEYGLSLLTDEQMNEENTPSVCSVASKVALGGPRHT